MLLDYVSRIFKGQDGWLGHRGHAVISGSESEFRIRQASNVAIESPDRNQRTDSQIEATS
jgi:hypothetical protein